MGGVAGGPLPQQAEGQLTVAPVSLPLSGATCNSVTFTEAL